MNRYTFPESDQKPGYFNVLDPSGAVVAEFWEDHARVIVTMYENMVRQSERLANEFMYGHILGMAHAMIYADRYPKFTTSRDADGQIILTQTDPLLGTVFSAPISEAPGAERHAETMLRKAFKQTDD